MRRFKETDVEWIGKIPQDWEVKPIKQVYRFQTGWTPTTSDESNFEGDNIWVNISDMKQRIIYDSAKHISDKAVAISSMNISPKGSLLYAFKLSVGAVAFCGKDLYTNEAIATFLPCENSLEYLFYAAPIFIIENANENIYGAKLLNQQLINNAKIVVPPIGEQQRIASYLDSKCSKIDSIIEKQQAVIEKLKEYKLSVITEAVTKGLNPDVEMKDSGVEWIGEVPNHWKIMRGKTLFYEVNQLSETGSEELLTVSQYTGVTPRSQKNVNMFKAESLEGYKICGIGDIAANTMWLWAGAIGVSNYHGIISPSYNVYRQKGSFFNSKFLDNLLRSVPLVQYYKALSTGIRASRLRLYPQQFLNIMFIVPPLHEQKKITDNLDLKINRIDNRIAHKRNVIEKLKEYKKSLIYEVVTGKKEV